MIVMVTCENKMLFTVSLFFMVSSSIADVTKRCGSKVGTTLTETVGSSPGSYTVEWCSELPVNAEKWKLELKYTANKTMDPCEENLSYNNRREIMNRIGKIPQRPFHMDISDRSTSCNITCLSKSLEMMYSGCYEIGNSYTDQYTSRPNFTFHRIEHIFDMEAINNLKPVTTFQVDEKEIVATYNLHHIPVENGLFSMEVKEYKLEAANNTKVKDEAEWTEITANCNIPNKFQLVCHWRAPSAGMCMLFSLKFHANWHNSVRDRNDQQYCLPPSDEVQAEPGTDARVWWAVGALALTLSLLAACWAAHSRVLADVRKKVLRRWLDRYETYAAEHTVTPASDPGYILLLYARDCEPAMDAVSVLKEMLEEGAPGRVYDIFSPSCMALYAQAPEEWMSGVLERSDVRVVLVQTPAAAALYKAQEPQDNLQMQQPLLGSRVQYKQPLYGDVLLQFALRLIRDMAPMQKEYARYYIANVSELEWELMPRVAPYRRYALPTHAARLLADLSLPADQPQRVRSLGAHVDRLLQYVEHNENYLRDELMFI